MFFGYLPQRLSSRCLDFSFLNDCEGIELTPPTKAFQHLLNGMLEEDCLLRFKWQDIIAHNWWREVYFNSVKDNTNHSTKLGGFFPEEWGVNGHPTTGLPTDENDYDNSLNSK